MAKRVVLAYSGGLDTSVAVRWLIEQHGVEVIAVAVDVGQEPTAGPKQWDAIRERALAAGAVEAVVVDARREMAEQFCVPAIKANAMYESKYPLVSALSRPLIVRHLVAEARRHGADAVAHGCTGQGQRPGALRGRDPLARPGPRDPRPGPGLGDVEGRLRRVRGQVRDPDRGDRREDLLDRREPLGPRHRVRGDRGPLGVAPDDAYTLTRMTAAEPVEVVVGFEAGAPVSLDGESLDSLDAHRARWPPSPASRGFGRIDMVENRRVGIKSREVYECPAALALLAAHSDLEDLTLERDVAPREDPPRAPVGRARLRRDVVLAAQGGPRRLRREHPAPRDRRGPDALRGARACCTIEGRRSPVALYDHDLATYDAAGPLPPPGRRGVRAHLRSRRRHLGGPPGAAERRR